MAAFPESALSMFFAWITTSRDFCISWTSSCDRKYSLTILPFLILDDLNICYSLNGLLYIDELPARRKTSSAQKMRRLQMFRHQLFLFHIPLDENLYRVN